MMEARLPVDEVELGSTMTILEERTEVTRPLR
jgi:hypothetical protein